MSMFAWLGIAVVIVAIAAVTGVKPKGTRHVANTRLMGVGRVFLFIMVAIVLYMAYQART